MNDQMIMEDILLTTKGVYRLEINPMQGQQTAEERVFLSMYQRVMSELRSAQMKDKAAGNTPSAMLVPNGN